MSIRSRMNPRFQTMEGGLFAEVQKADVGGSYMDMAKQGIDLMGWADPFTPDYVLPPSVLSEFEKALHDPLGAHYTAPIGNDKLKQLIAKKIQQKNGIAIDWKRNLIITPGSDSGLYYAMLPFIEPGDEVMVPVPCYPNNLQNIQTMGASPIYIPLRVENGYQFDISDFDRLVTDKTKMVVLTHPNNPTTTVYHRESLEKLCAFIVKHNLILVCDQAFEDFIYDQREFITPASLPGMWERTVTVFSVSKGMGFSGIRVGYLMSCDTIMDVLHGAAVSVIGATHTISQLAVMEAFKDMSFMEEFRKAFDECRHMAYDILNQVPHVSLLLPESGFLCWVDVHELGTDQEIYTYLLKEAKVAVNGGVAYGPGGEGHLRIVLGVYRDSNKVYQALQHIADALKKYPNADQ